MKKEFCCRDILFKYSSCKVSKNCRDTRNFGRDINQTTSAELCRDKIQEESIKNVATKTTCHDKMLGNIDENYVATKFSMS